MVNVPDRQARRVAGRVPVMRETRYDLTSSMVIAAALVLITSVIALITVWLSNLLPEQVTTDVTMVAGEGNSPEGEQDELLEVESPEDPSDDPSLSNDQEQTQLEEVLERMVSASGEAVQFKVASDFSDPSAHGSLGSSAGTGRPFGPGGSRRAGIPREQRWVVEFSEPGGLEVYAQQLDFFGIELGAVYPDGRVVYVGKLSEGFLVREARIDSGDTRLFMSWEQGDREKADRKLLADAGITDAEPARIVHFYAPETEELLARLEEEHAGRPSEQIRRTRFRATGQPGAFEFVVESQRYR